MIKNTFIYGILFLTLISCGGTEKKTSEYIYKNGESSVRLKILDGKDYLIYDTPTRMDFEWTNIDPKTSYIVGTGIKILGTKDGITKTEIKVPNNYLKTDTLNIRLRFEINGEKINNEFNVPMRNKK